MTYLIPIAAGFFGAYLILQLKDELSPNKKPEAKINSILSVICLVLVLVLLPMYGAQDALHIAVSYIFLAVSAVTALAFKDRIATLYNAMEKACREAEKEDTAKREKAPAKEDEELTEEEEEEMKKQQKIITVLCVVLILYMIVSTFCIYRLNNKINTLYEITMEQNK